ncbi:MAG: FAD-dependent oxidoreductase, partial [Pseudomonadota bacterium]
MSESAIVVGGGLIGLLTARELVSRGVHVSVIEKGDVGRAASWAAAPA